MEKKVIQNDNRQETVCPMQVRLFPAYPTSLFSRHERREINSLFLMVYYDITPVAGLISLPQKWHFETPTGNLVPHSGQIIVFICRIKSLIT